MFAVGVSGTVDGHGLDSHLLAGLHDAAGDLTTVGDEDLVKRLQKKRQKPGQASFSQKKKKKKKGTERSTLPIDGLGAMVALPLTANWLMAAN